MLEHGGRLHRAAREYGRPPGQWLDLSTGISPFAWPVPAVPARAWHRLPEDDDGLEVVAQHYYGTPHVLPVAGSQAAIQALPTLRRPSRVGIIAPGYAEHAQAWRNAGHEVVCLPASALLERPEAWDVVLLIHPNNPGGERFDRDALLALHAQLAARGGWLLVDEAFMDATPEHSLCRACGDEGLVVLRSVGKFFGLAGARAGFVCAAPALLTALRERLGPWTVSGPSRWVVTRALGDRSWQQEARTYLHVASRRLHALLTRHGLVPAGGCALFQWCPHAQAGRVQRALAGQGILVRAFDTPPSLRFGVPADAAAFARLDAALAELVL